MKKGLISLLCLALVVSAPACRKRKNGQKKTKKMAMHRKAVQRKRVAKGKKATTKRRKVAQNKKTTTRKRVAKRAKKNTNSKKVAQRNVKRKAS